MAVFFILFLFICLFIFSAAPCFGNYDNSPGPGRKTCISSAHSAWRQVIKTHHDWQASKWLVKLSFPPPIPATQHYHTDLPPAISFTKIGACGNSGQLFFFFLNSFFMGPWQHLGPGAAAPVVAPILTPLLRSQIDLKRYLLPLQPKSSLWLLKVKSCECTTSITLKGSK